MIVVDDESTDETALIASKFGAKVVPIELRPKGFAPKAYACHKDYLQSKGDVAVFLDADTIVSPKFIERVSLHFCKSSNRVLSLQPFHRTTSPLQTLAVFFHVASIVGSGLFSLVHFSVGLFGPCIAIRREAYDLVDGFANEKVSGSFVEDVELSQVLKEEGIEFKRYLGTGILENTMYPDFRSMVLGWKKAISLGAGKTPIIVLIFIVTLIGSLIGIPVTLVVNSDQETFGLILLLQNLILLLLVVNVAVRLGNYVLAAIAYPISILVFVIVFSMSIVSTLFRKDVIWAGRALQLKSN